MVHDVAIAVFGEAVVFGLVLLVLVLVVKSACAWVHPSLASDDSEGELDDDVPDSSSEDELDTDVPDTEGASRRTSNAQRQFVAKMRKMPLDVKGTHKVGTFATFYAAQTAVNAFAGVKKEHAGWLYMTTRTMRVNERYHVLIAYKRFK